MPATLEISLPEPLNEFVHEQVRSGRFRDASAFIASLISEDIKMQTPGPGTQIESNKSRLRNTKIHVEQMIEAVNKLGTPVPEDVEVYVGPDEASTLS